MLLKINDLSHLAFVNIKPVGTGSVEWEWLPILALVQLNGNNFLFYNKSLGDLNVEKFTYLIFPFDAFIQC
jgi:hypothetical protein